MREAPEKSRKYLLFVKDPVVNWDGNTPNGQKSRFLRAGEGRVRVAGLARLLRAIFLWLYGSRCIVTLVCPILLEMSR
jgi:hypothetical protein